MASYRLTPIAGGHSPSASIIFRILHMAPEDNYLAVLKASFDYDPQEGSEDELAIKENQLLFLLERTDESSAIHQLI